MDLLAVILVDGLIYGAWLFIVSVGLTLTFGVLNILNMAHGGLYAIGAYTTATAVGIFFANGGDGELEGVLHGLDLSSHPVKDQTQTNGATGLLPNPTV